MDNVKLAPEERFEVVGVDPFEGAVQSGKLRVAITDHVAVARTPQNLNVQMLLSLGVP